MPDSTRKSERGGEGRGEGEPLSQLNSYVFRHSPFPIFDYLLIVQTFGDQLDKLSSLQQQVTVPDLWQQEAVSALREGKDVVVQAPTGAGKTLIFELWSNSGKPRGQAIYTVPTRALANDKLAEWRARGWDVEIG